MFMGVGNHLLDSLIIVKPKDRFWGRSVAQKFGGVVSMLSRVHLSRGGQAMATTLGNGIVEPGR